MNSIIIGWNVIKRLAQQRLAFCFLVIFPILAGLFVVLMMGKAEGTKQMVAVVNLDRGPMGRELISFLESTEKYSMREIDEKLIGKEVENEEVSAGIIIPENYSESLGAKQGAMIKMICTRPSVSYTKLREIINMYIGGAYSGKPFAMDGEKEKSGALTDQTRTYLGFLLIMIMLFMGTGIGMILEDKQEKTFMRTFAAPVREYEMVLGNILASLFLGIVQITLYLLCSTYIFKVDWGTSLINVFIISLIYLVAAVGISTGISGFINDNQKYSSLNLFTVVPVSILGGCFFSVSMLPEVIQKVSDFIPQKWAMDALEKLAAGGEFGSISMNLLILLLFGLVFFTFGIKTLGVRNEDL
jgi:ABC-type multidrug transport system permease subunit